MVQLLAYDIDAGQWRNLDVPSDLTISVNKSIEEVQDITQRKTSFTKTFLIPSTDNNERFFRSAFNVNATDFNNKLQTTCVIQSGGNDVFRGKMRLNKVIVEPQGTQYEVYIVQEIAPFSSVLQNFNICQLNYEDVQHELIYDNIIATWEYTGGTYSNYSGITGNVLYPIANTGYDPDLSYGTFGVGGSNFTNQNEPITIDQFKPWLNLRYMIDLIFEEAGFRYDSQFFNTDYFQSIFVLAGNNSGMGTAVIGDRPENQNVFLSTYEGTNYFYDYPNPLDAWNYFVYNTIEYDYLDQFNESGFPATGPGTGKNWFTVPITGNYQFHIEQEIFIAGTAYAPTYIDVAIRDIDTGSIESIQSGVPIPVGSATRKIFFLNASLTKGQRVAVMFRRQTTGGDPYNKLGFRPGTDGAFWELYNSPNVVPNLGDVYWEDNLPCDITALEFLKDVIGVFNLVVIPNGENSFLIEPWTNYLSSASGTTYDWSDKLDYNSTYEITPLDFDLQRILHLTYSEADDVLNDYFINQFNAIFGEKFFEKQSDLLSGTQKLQFNFEPLPTDSIASGSTMIIPELYRLGEPNTDPRQTPMSLGLRLGFYCGKQYFYTGSTNSDNAEYFILSGTTSVGHDTYPVISHLSQLTEKDDVPFSDLNFEPTYDFFMDNTDFKGYTPNNLYRYWYKPYLELLYSDEARIFKGNFILTPEDISKINFNDSVYFLNSRWRLYSINDGDITDKSLVECEFLKEPYKTQEISDPVAPDYVSQNTPRPTPTPTPTNTLYWYIDNNLASPYDTNINSLSLTVYQGTTEYLNQTSAGSGTVQVPSGTNIYTFSIIWVNVVGGSFNNLRLCLGTSPGDCSLGQTDIPQPSSGVGYTVQATNYFPASGNIYATITTY